MKTSAVGGLYLDSGRDTSPAERCLGLCCLHPRRLLPLSASHSEHGEVHRDQSRSPASRFFLQLWICILLSSCAPWVSCAGSLDPVVPTSGASFLPRLFILLKAETGTERVPTELSLNAPASLSTCMRAHTHTHTHTQFQFSSTVQNISTVSPSVKPGPPGAHGGGGIWGHGQSHLIISYSLQTTFSSCLASQPPGGPAGACIPGVPWWSLCLHALPSGRFSAPPHLSSNVPSGRPCGQSPCGKCQPPRSTSRLPFPDSFTSFPLQSLAL